jgi:uncharacterized phage protein (TIGR01671 family)
MREIKFRAWDKINKVMYSDVHEKDSFAEKLSRSNEYHIMQFTGLKDKNGKEIFEGDVLSYPIPNDEMRGVIIWGKYEYIVEYSYENADYIATIGEDGCEVIGNIYENPELVNHEPS